MTAAASRFSRRELPLLPALFVSYLQAGPIRDAFEGVFHKPVLHQQVDVAPPVSRVRFIEEPTAELGAPLEYEYPLELAGRLAATTRWTNLPIELPEY